MSSSIQHGVPGEWARVRGTMLSLWPLFVAFACLGAFASAVFTGKGVLFFGVLFILSLGAVAVLWRKGERRVSSFFIGARGEERVANELRGLSSSYHVFHDFLAGSKVVDHLVVGPTGIFSVETKNWSGRITVEDELVKVNGALPSRQPVNQALEEAAAVREVLVKAGCEQSVVPLVCFAASNVEPSRSELGAAFVVALNETVDFISKRAIVLTPEEVDRIANLLDV